MPLTCVIVAVATHWFTGLGWTESFLVGALLSPTDPVLSSRVVTNPRVPRVVRHSLNLESGMNDGLALPAVLAFSAALAGDDDFVWWHFVLQDVTLGFAFGIAIGLLAGSSRATVTEEGSPRTSCRCTRSASRSLTYGVTVLPPAGNGLIAVFVCAITLGIRRPDLRHTFEERADDIVEIVKLGVFVVFGSLLTLDGLFSDGWAAVAVVAMTLLIARPVAIAVALIGTSCRSTCRRSWRGSAPRALPRWRSRCSCWARASPAPSGSSTSPRCASSPRSWRTG